MKSTNVYNTEVPVFPRGHDRGPRGWLLYAVSIALSFLPGINGSNRFFNYGRRVRGKKREHTGYP